MILPGVFAVLVGLLMIGQWGFSLYTRQVPELQTEPMRIRFHIGAEFVTAVVLIVGGLGLLPSMAWSRQFYLVAVGMLIYTLIQSPGYFADQRQWPLVGLFAVLMILALFSLAAVLSV